MISITTNVTSRLISGNSTAIANSLTDDSYLSKNTQKVINFPPDRKNSATLPSRNQKLEKIDRTYPLPPLSHPYGNWKYRKYGVISDAKK